MANWGVCVIVDKSKYNDYKAFFLHRATSVEDALTYNPDINTYFTFDTELEARRWILKSARTISYTFRRFAVWAQSSVCLNHLSYQSFPKSYFSKASITDSPNYRNQKSKRFT